MKKVFRYIEPLWCSENNGKRKFSLRKTGAIAIIIDFIINVHNSATGVLKLLYTNQEFSAERLVALSGILSQIAMILGIEVALIGGLLALKTYQNNVMIKQNPNPMNSNEEGA